MAEQDAAKPQIVRNTREFRNINAVKDLPNYRLPAAGVVSILHRISGFVLALLLPLIVWMLDQTLTSEFSYAAFTGVFSAWYVKAVFLGIAWAFLHHLCAGVRHLFMDMHWGMDKDSSKNSALAVFAVSLPLTLAIGLKMFGVF
jgi:succinate dehydrogenase / fumarate reductase, cytochrome b subunit